MSAPRQKNPSRLLNTTVAPSVFGAAASRVGFVHYQLGLARLSISLQVPRAARAWGLRPGAVSLLATPLFHVGGLGWGLAAGVSYASYYIFGKWVLRRYAPVTIYAVVLPIGALGLLPRVKASTKNEGPERLYFYGSVWAVCIAQPVLWLLWTVLPEGRVFDIAKLVIFVGILARAAQRYDVEVQAYVCAGNHLHGLLSPADAHELAGFMRYLLTNLSKEAGRLHCWRGPLLQRRYQAILVSEEDAAQLGRLRYLLARGAYESLVARVIASSCRPTSCTSSRRSRSRGSAITACSSRRSPRCWRSSAATPRSRSCCGTSCGTPRSCSWSTGWPSGRWCWRSRCCWSLPSLPRTRWRLATCSRRASCLREHRTGSAASTC